MPSATGNEATGGRRCRSPNCTPPKWLQRVLPFYLFHFGELDDDAGTRDCEIANRCLYQDVY